VSEWANPLTSKWAPDLTTEIGDDPSRCLLAFGGVCHGINMAPMEFHRATEGLDWTRVFVRDLSVSWYLLDDEGHPALNRTLQAVAEELERLQPERIVVVGASAGGFMALRAGHYLRADTVHAFGPQTTVDREHLRGMDGRFDAALAKVWTAGLPADHLDIVPDLSEWNGRTRYHLHTCQDSADVAHAKRIAGPEVTWHRWPCSGHVPAKWMRDEGTLAEVITW